jgi:Fe2+ or Zn2+ uptake regulation protein
MILDNNWSIEKKMAGKVIQRNTKQKSAILKVLNQTNTHPTAEWIHEKTRKIIPSISLATVYRNLRQLSKDDQIREINYRNNITRYDGRVDGHHHFICSQCERIYDIFQKVSIENYKDLTELQSSEIKGFQIEFFGVCEKCKETKNKS